MYRFLLRPKWIVFHIAVFAAVALMLSAASWQWTKHLARDEFVAKVQDRQDAPAADLVPLLAERSPEEIEYLRVAATGSYLSGVQLTEINRTQDGVNGINVLTPFQIEGGPIVIVNRGFVADGTELPEPPTGTLRIGGTARTSEPRRTGELTDNDDAASTAVRRVDLPLIAEKLGVTVAPVFIDFIASDPPTEQPPTPVPAPDLSGGPPHVSYTVQWIIFSLCAVAGWIFAIRRSSRTHRREVAKAASPEALGVTEPLSVDDPALPSA